MEVKELRKAIETCKDINATVGLPVDSGSLFARALEMTLIGHAVRLNSPECIQLAIERKADVNLSGSNERISPLALCVEWNGTRQCAKLLIDARCDVEMRDRFDRTPLFYAILVCPSTEMIRLLLKSGASINAVCCRTGNRPMSVLQEAKQGATQAFGSQERSMATNYLRILQGTKDLSWSPDNHKHFDPNNKALVSALLILHRSVAKFGCDKVKRLKAYHDDENNRFWKLPKPLLMRVLSFAIPTVRYVPE